METENKISYDIRGAAFRVHSNLGPGLLESVYEYAMIRELVKIGHKVSNQVALPVYYDGVKLDIGFRIDLMVDEKMIIEIKSVDQLIDVHHKQLLTYLKLTGIRLGLLINFNCLDLKKSIIRIIN